jgi:hypothetical protein
MSSSSSFSDSFSDAQNTVKQAQSTISAGIIAAIVIVCVVVLASAIGVFCLYRRQQRRRAARMAPFEPKYDGSSAYYQQAPAANGTPFLSPHQQYASPYNPNQRNEAPGHAVEPRWEAASTPAPLPEMHANEAKVEPPVIDNSKHELTGSNAQRSELAA